MTSELVCSITAHDAAHGVGLFTVQWPFPTRTEEDEEDTNFVADPGPQWDLWYGKLDACRTLQEGWNGYTAPAPGDAAIENARTFLDVMRQAGLGPTRLAPSAMGGVAVTQKAGNRKVLVEFYNDGRAFALFSLRGGDMRVAPVALGVDAFRHFLDEMREYLNV